MTAVYERNQLTWEQDDLDAMVEKGQAKTFRTVKGYHYVVKTGHGSVAVRPDQIRHTPDPLAYIPDPKDLSSLRSRIERDDDLSAARKAEDDLLAKFL